MIGLNMCISGVIMRFVGSVMCLGNVVLMIFGVIFVNMMIRNVMMLVVIDSVRLLWLNVWSVSDVVRMGMIVLNRLLLIRIMLSSKLVCVSSFCVVFVLSVFWLVRCFS